MPERIQLRRTKGYRKPPGAIVVARPSRWGNPIEVGSCASTSVIGADGLSYDHAIPVTRAIAVAMYRAEIESRLTGYPGEHPEDRKHRLEFAGEIEALRGHDLACWCPLDQPCHADVLLDLANQ